MDIVHMSQLIGQQLIVQEHGRTVARGVVCDIIIQFMLEGDCVSIPARVIADAIDLGDGAHFELDDGTDGTLTLIPVRNSAQTRSS